MAKKKRNISPRKKKKQEALLQSKLRRLEAAGFSKSKASEIVGSKSAPITNRQIEKIVAEKEKREAAATRRYNSNKEYLKKHGVPTDIISKSTTIKETKKRAEEYLKNKAAKEAKTDRQKRQANLVARKINRLIDAGFSHAEAEKLVGSFWRPASDKKIADIIEEKRKPPINSDIPLTGKTYLYVGVCEVKDGFHVPNTKGLTTDQLKDYVTDILRSAQYTPDGSGSMSSVFTYARGTKARMERRAEVFYKRGYNLDPAHHKLSPQQYQKITVSNTWSEHEFFSMFYTCISQMKNHDVLDFNDYLKDYCKMNGFPFMDDFPYLDKK